MVKHRRHSGWGSSPQSSRQVKKYGTIVGSSPTCSTKEFIDILDKAKGKASGWIRSDS